MLAEIGTAEAAEKTIRSDCHVAVPRRGLMLAILLAIYAFNYVDRQILALVLEDIKRDLDLTDTQLGLLSGLAFALFYAACGIPIAWLADRWNRARIISATVALWSVFVALCGSATSFGQLFLVRIGVAVGEAGCIPPAQSLLADAYPRSERARAFSIYSLGSPLSVVLGGFAAGWINQFYGWRATFVILALPGVLLALAAWVALRDPRQEPRLAQAAAPVAGPQDVRMTVKILWSNRTYRHLLIAHTILYFFIYGIVVQWQPTFFIRSYGMSTGELGTWQLFIWAVMGTLGTVAGGQLCHRYFGENEDAQLKLVSLSVIVFGLLNIAIYLSAQKYLALGLMAVAVPFYTAVFGPMFAVNQAIVPERTRALAVAVMLFFANLVGMGLGGVGTGFLSDQLAEAVGPESLRYALLILSPGFFWCAFHFWLASRSVERAIQSAAGR